MAIKYCDHGAYTANGTFSAGTSGSSTTLTLSSSGGFTGDLCPGMFLSGSGITAETYITAVIYNSAKVVTAVTMNTARTVPAGTTITTSGAGSPAIVPRWGYAQDGDGTQLEPGTPATASITFTGIPSSGTIQVMGQTLSPAWATDANTCANNLAAAINASALTATAPASFDTKSQIRNHLYARGPSTGAAAGTCEIMTRQASADHADKVLITHTLNNVSSPGTISLIGGTGGCWGYVFNPTTSAWPSAIALCGYGVWAATVPFAGTLAADDVVKVRANKTVRLYLNATATWTMAAMGTYSSNVRFDIDTGDTWPSDAPDPVFKITQATTANSGYTWAHTHNTYAHINGAMYSDGSRNLVLEGTGSGANIPAIIVGTGGPIRFDYLEIYIPGTPTAIPGPVATGSAQFKSVAASDFGRGSTLYKCKVTQPGQAPSSAVYGLVNQPLNQTERAEFIGCSFNLTAAPTAWTSGVMSLFSGGAPSRYTFESCSFNGFVTGSRLGGGSSQLSAEQSAVFKNCSFGGITDFGPFMLGSPTGDGLGAGPRGLFISSQYGSREFFMEQPGRLMVEWVAAKGRPCLNARLPDGITPWQIYAVTGTAPTAFSKNTPANLPEIKKLMPLAADYAEAPRTFTVNFLVESTLSWTKADISIVISYMSASGTLETVDSYDPDGGALTDSSAEWSATSWNGQTWLRKAFSVTTPLAVKGDSEVSIQVRLHSPVANDTLGVIIDPEIVVT